MALMRLSKAYAARPEHVSPTHTVTIAGAGSFAIDVANMTQRNTTSGAVRRITCVRGLLSQASVVSSPNGSPSTAAARRPAPPQSQFPEGHPFFTAPLFTLTREDRKYPLGELRGLVESNPHAPPAGCRVLYHQTTEAAAQSILGSSKMQRGARGKVGGGIYFAESAAVTHRKAQHKGTVLRCIVYMGTVKTVSGVNSDHSFSSLRAEGYDSVHLTGLGDGDEFIVYNWDQVLHICREG